MTWLHKMRDVNSKFMRWALKIQDFQPNIVHCPGRYNVVADALSRAPVFEAEEEEYKEVMDPPKSSFLPLFLALTTDITINRIKDEQSSDGEVSSLLTDLPPNFSVVDNVLYKVNKNGVKLPYIPKSLRPSVLKYFHDEPHSGHLGFRKTIQRLTRRVYWIGMQEDIFAYIRACETCQKHKNPNSKPHGQLQSVLKNGPWDMLALDLMGPLPSTKYRKTQLLVVVDHFSKWVELFAIRDAKAPAICDLLEKEIFCRWGAPSSILSDNATNFRSRSFAKLCENWGIKQKFTASYHPQCNITERVNRNLRTMIASYIQSKHNKWDEHLHELALALRTAVNDTTGFSPAYLNFGREIKLPFDRLVNNASDEFESRTDYKSELVKRLLHAVCMAKSSFEKAHMQQRKHYDNKHKQLTFKLHDKVLLRTHFLSKASEKFAKKLAPRWKGPFAIARVISNVSYALCDPDTGTDMGTHNVKNLKPFYDKPSTSDC